MSSATETPGTPTGPIEALSDLEALTETVTTLLGGLVALALLVVFFWRLRGRTRPAVANGESARLELLETLRLDPRRSLHLVRVDEGLALVAASEAGLVPVSVATSEIASEQETSSSPATLHRAFADRLRENGVPMNDRSPLPVTGDAP